MSDPSPPSVPEAVLERARARADARAERDFATADRLRAEIEAAGWKVVDQGTDFHLEPAHPADVSEGDVVRYGSSASVPSRLDAPPSTAASAVLVATDWPADLARTLAGLQRHGPADLQIVVVADDPSPEQAAALEPLDPRPQSGDRAASDGRPDEIVWTSARLGTAAAIDCGVRRASGAVVVLLDTSVEPTGDIVAPLLAALDDPSVGVAGGWGIVSDDLRTFREATPGDVDAVEAYCLAFRRGDFVTRGPLDERFRFYRNLDIWWSLVLRDEGQDRPPRRAVALALPAERHEHRGYASLPPDERDRQSRRNFYRIIDRFGARRDLLISARG